MKSRYPNKACEEVDVLSSDIVKLITLRAVKLINEFQDPIPLLMWTN